jgi:hypothetical protein
MTRDGAATYSEALRTAFAGRGEEPPPAPWRQIPTYVGGITAMGFGPGTDLLLLLSSRGVGVLDCTSGKTVARQHDDHDLVDDAYPVEVRGIGPLAGRVVPVAGLWGGGQRRMSPDGWCVHRIAPDWPCEGVVLCPPRAPELEDDPGAARVLRICDVGIRAFGFLGTGRSLAVVVEDAGWLTVWHRSG